MAFVNHKYGAYPQFCPLRLRMARECAMLMRGGICLHETMMREALILAERAAALGEVPVGCVVVRGDEIVGRGFNRRESGKSALLHAEIEAIGEACRTLGGWRLWQCRLYVTLEPCPMCAGAIINARIPELYYGASDPKGGAVGSVCNLFEMPFNHKLAVQAGLLEDECAAILRDFFRKMRAERG